MAAAHAGKLENGFIEMAPVGQRVEFADRAGLGIQVMEFDRAGDDGDSHIAAVAL